MNWFDKQKDMIDVDGVFTVTFLSIFVLFMYNLFTTRIWYLNFVTYLYMVPVIFATLSFILYKKQKSLRFIKTNLWHQTMQVRLKFYGKLMFIMVVYTIVYTLSAVFSNWYFVFATNVVAFVMYAFMYMQVNKSRFVNGRI